MWSVDAVQTRFGFGDLPRYVTGLAAMALMLGTIREGGDLSLLLASAFLLLCCVTDTFTGQIPNPLNLTMLLSGFVYQGWTAGPAGLLTALLGLTTGFALLLVPYLLGGMGGGDVKALAALGALLGPSDIFQTFLYAGLVGGLMAVLHYLCNRNLRQKCRQGLQALRVYAYTGDFRALLPHGPVEPLRFPYAAAFAFGYGLFVFRGGVL